MKLIVSWRRIRLLGLGIRFSDVDVHVMIVMMDSIN